MIRAAPILPRPVVGGPIKKRPPTIERDKDGEPDPRALKILDRAFWSGGWKRSAVPPTDLAYAIDAGLMFEPIDPSHDGAVEWAIEARSAVTAPLVAASFVESLSTQRLDLRSALGSWAATTHLKPHRPDGRICDICRSSLGEDGQASQDLNVLNFERFKFGGVRHRQPLYAAFDLHQLAQWRRAEIPHSLDVLNAILDRWSNLPDSAQATDAANALKGLIKSNQNERRTVVEIAALAGILKSDADPPTKRLITYAEQEANHPGGKSDWGYPAHTWRGHMGVDPTAILGLLSAR